jgi:hypothetical protein
MSNRQWKRSDPGSSSKIVEGPKILPKYPSKSWASTVDTKSSIPTKHSNKWKKGDSLSIDLTTVNNNQLETHSHRPQHDAISDQLPEGSRGSLQGSVSTVMDPHHKHFSEAHSGWTRTGHTKKSLVRIQPQSDSAKNSSYGSIARDKNQGVWDPNLREPSGSWSMNTSVAKNKKWRRVENSDEEEPIESSTSTHPPFQPLTVAKGRMTQDPYTVGTVLRKWPRNDMETINESVLPRVKRIRLTRQHSASIDDTNDVTQASHHPISKIDSIEEESVGGLTDFAYRETSRMKGSKRFTTGPSSSNRHMGVVRVKPVLDQTPICPSFLDGSVCDNELCTFRHDVPIKATMPLCSFFQKNGQCLKIGSCPFRHVKVSDSAPICPSFQRLGFCDNAQCTMKHIRSTRNLKR